MQDTSVDGDAVTSLWIVGGGFAATCAVTVYTSTSPIGSSGIVSLIGPVPFAFGQYVPAQVQLKPVMPVGNGSDTTTSFSGSVPALRTSMVKVRVPPGT